MRLVGGDGGQIEARRTPNKLLGVVKGRWRQGEPTNKSRRLIGGFLAFICPLILLNYKYVDSFFYGTHVNPHFDPIRVLIPMGYTQPITLTYQNPYPGVRVRVLTGTGTGCPEKPQGSPCHSLMMQVVCDNESIYDTRVYLWNVTLEYRASGPLLQPLHSHIM